MKKVKAAKPLWGAEVIKKYMAKWMSLLAIVLILGGVFSFGLIAFFANAIGGNESGYDPVWMVGMIPLMILIATPITIFISRQLTRHVELLTRSMKEVADGKLYTYIPTADAGAFCEVYENFNKMASEIQSVQALRTEMIDSFSHELKTPVASINGFARLLEEDGLSDEKRKQYVGIIIRESDRLAALASGTLLLSKLDAQEIVADKKQYNLGRQLQECAINLEPSWSEKNIGMTAELDENVIFYGNADLMESVWTNLLTNAIKFTPSRGEIRITLKESDGRAVVQISDNGIGMSEKVLSRIFERYYQGDKSHAERGHGLGLAIVRRIVRLCGGGIEVASIEGEGSAFTVSLPLNG